MVVSRDKASSIDVVGVHFLCLDLFFSNEINGIFSEFLNFCKGLYGLLDCPSSSRSQVPRFSAAVPNFLFLQKAVLKDFTLRKCSLTYFSFCRRSELSGISIFSDAEKIVDIKLDQNHFFFHANIAYDSLIRISGIIWLR